MITYPGGAVVNQAGNLIDIAVNIPILEQLHDDPKLGLTLPFNIPIWTHFTSDSFYRADIPDQLAAFYISVRSYLLTRYCQEQGVNPQGNVFVAISVADKWKAVSDENPGLASTDRLFKDALERRLAETYIQGAKIFVAQRFNRPSIELPQITLDQALERGLPFRIININPNLRDEVSA